eukprot:6271657-Amphidinium_carterae.1
MSGHRGREGGEVGVVLRLSPNDIQCAVKQSIHHADETPWSAIEPPALGVAAHEVPSFSKCCLAAHSTTHEVLVEGELKGPSLRHVDVRGWSSIAVFAKAVAAVKSAYSTTAFSSNTQTLVAMGGYNHLSHHLALADSAKAALWDSVLPRMFVWVISLPKLLSCVLQLHVPSAEGAQHATAHERSPSNEKCMP